MSNLQSTPPPFPFKTLFSKKNYRVIWNMKTDNLYLEKWTGFYWQSIEDLEKAKKILKKLTPSFKYD